MEFDFYQGQASATAVFSQDMKITYPSLGLANEVGEVLGKVKKVFRDHDGVFTPHLTAEIGDELGDVLWYLNALATSLGLKLEDIAFNNLEKLADRAKRGVIKGSGDKR